MEKLTLEHISPYGKGLKYLNEKSGNIVTSIGCYEVNNDIVVASFDGAKFYNLEVWPLKPLVRPMDLTKPIQVEGKEIVPLIELAKIAFPDRMWKLNGIVAINEKGFHFFYNDGFIYILGVRCYEIPSQLALFQWLFKHKFDVFGLIEKGLAIDVNTLETDPYANR